MLCGKVLCTFSLFRNKSYIEIMQNAFYIGTFEPSIFIFIILCGATIFHFHHSRAKLPSNPSLFYSSTFPFTAFFLHLLTLLITFASFTIQGPFLCSWQFSFNLVFAAVGHQHLTTSNLNIHHHYNEDKETKYMCLLL